ncbi:MAG: ParA family protein [Pseudomonadota bacterium]
MQRQQKQSKSTRRILIINGKGGCGKSTIATNLAAAYASRGLSAALVDYDSQASSTDWHELRDSAAPTVTVIPMHQRVSMYQTRAFSHQVPTDCERIIIDTPSGARERNIDQLIKQSDVILVPMLPSPLDVRSGSRFIAELLTHRGFRAQPRAVGVIVNRLQPNNPIQAKLLHSLECLDVPCIATFQDSTLYSRAAEAGAGVVEIDQEGDADRSECDKWFELIEWIETQPRRTARAPVAAGPHRSAVRSAAT